MFRVDGRCLSWANSALGRCRLNVRVTPDSGGVRDTCPKTSDDGVTTNYVWEAKLIPFSRSVGCMSIILLGYADEPLADRFCYRTGQFRITIRAANLAS